MENPHIWPRVQGEVEESRRVYKICILNKKFRYLQRKVYEKKEKKALEVNVNNVLCSSDIGNTLKYYTYRELLLVVYIHTHKILRIRKKTTI